MNPYRHIASALLLATVVLATPFPVAGARFNVDTTVDDVAATACDDLAPGDCSLRGAIAAANALAEASTINVPAGTYVLGQSSTCTYQDKTLFPPGIVTSDRVSLCVNSQLTIKGAGAASTIIDGDQRGRVLLVSGEAVADLRDITLTNGIGDLTYGAGGIQNHGTLTLAETVVSDNTLPAGTPGFAGSIQNLGSLTVLRSTVAGNQGSGISNDGGRIHFNNFVFANGFAYPGPVLTISDSTISNNTAMGPSPNDITGAHGGGILNFAGGVGGSALTVTNSTINGNSAGFHGGGVANINSGVSRAASVTVINSTISGNSSGLSGGGIYNGSGTAVWLNNVTIADNTAGARLVNVERSGGGIYNESPGVLTMQNTLVAGNRDVGSDPAPDCLAGGNGHGSPVMSQGHNLIQDSTFCLLAGDTTGNLTGIDPMIGPLADNGGATPTHALVTGSSAIDAGRPVPLPGSSGVACAAADQRGALRPMGAACDIGAYEGIEAGAPLRITPDRGGNAGSVVVLIYGFNVTGNATVKLIRAGEPEIVGNPVKLSAISSLLSTSFDLTGRATGAWDVVVRGSDGTSSVLPGGFTVEEVRTPELWTDIIGTTEIRFGRPAKFTVFFGNRGNVDAIGVPLTLSVPSNYDLSVFVSFAPPPVQPGQTRDDWSQVPVHVQTDAANAVENVPLLLPVIPAGFTGTFQIELTANADSSSVILADFGDPVFTPHLDPAVVSTAVAGVQDYLQPFGVVIPGTSVPALEQYVGAQYRQAVDNGRTAFISSFGTELRMYPVARLFFDAVFFAAAQVADSAQTSAARTTSQHWLSGPVRSLRTLLATLSPESAEAAGIVPCAGGVLPEGSSCTPVEKIFPPDIPLPPGCDLKNPSTFKNCKPTEAHCTALGTHKVVRTTAGVFCTPEKPPKNCPAINIDNPLLGSGNAACKTWPVALIKSADPNDKVGSLGVMPERFLVSTTPLSYTVFFENIPTATAAAQEVVISDQLDMTVMDLDTFRLGPLSFGDITVVPAPGSRQFTGGVDLRPEQDLIVAIQAGLDPNTGLLTWRFSAVDPATGQLTDDPVAGFLPPNVNPPEGEGSLVFTVEPRAGLATGTTICNQASIVFDVNAAILTPEWCNIVDDTPPISQMIPLSPTQPNASFTLEWSGTDAGSGIADYTIYVSENGAPFIPFVSDTTATSALFTGLRGSTYAFFSVARDQAGHVESAPNLADTQTIIDAPVDESPSPSPTITATPTRIATGSPTDTATATATQSATVTASETATNTALPSPTATPTGTATQTATSTDTATPAPTASASSPSTETPTLAPTDTRTETATRTATRTPTAPLPSPKPSRPPTVCADLDGDGRVTARDVAIQAMAMGGRSRQPGVDFNGDGRIDVFDLLIVVKQLRQTCSAGARPSVLFGASAAAR